MTTDVNLAFLASSLCLTGQLVSIAVAWPRRIRQAAPAVQAAQCDLTVIRPLSGVEAWSETALRSTFELDHKNLKILFCVAQADDPIVLVARRVMAEYPAVKAEILVGNEAISANPKLNNLIKGWERTTTDWVAFIDSNVLLPRDAVARLLDSWDDKCGMVCAPPIGAQAIGAAAVLETMFLNAYQARWQIAASSLGMGFAQGKVMFFKRALLTTAGGLGALASDPAEDAAATKVVRAAGLHVRLVAAPFDQPLGRRRLLDVWKRQLRWAQLRRATFPLFFYLEIATGAVLPSILLAIGLGAQSLVVLPIYLAIWYGAECALAARYGWHLSFWSLPLSIIRDALIIPIWIVANFKSNFDWQGHAMRVDQPNAVS